MTKVTLNQAQAYKYKGIIYDLETMYALEIVFANDFKAIKKYTEENYSSDDAGLSYQDIDQTPETYKTIITELN